jgi:hypothetical protein
MITVIFRQQGLNKKRCLNLFQNLNFLLVFDQKRLKIDVFLVFFNQKVAVLSCF